MFYLPQLGRQNIHGLAVFGDGAAGDVEALAFEDVGDFLVTEWFLFRFIFDQLPDPLFHSGRRCVSARAGADTG